MIRIDSGQLKGLKLEVAESIRPTQAKLRQAVGNILQNRLQGAKVLDICAGSGAVGLELVSRGAEYLVGLEKDPLVFKILQKNYRAAGDRLNLKNSLLPIFSDWEIYLKNSKKLNLTKFDIIWFDPPYADFDGYLAQLLEIAANIANSDGVLLCEMSRKSFANFLEQKANFPHVDITEKKFGDTMLVILEMKNQ